MASELRNISDMNPHDALVKKVLDKCMHVFKFSFKFGRIKSIKSKNYGIVLKGTKELLELFDELYKEQPYKDIAIMRRKIKMSYSNIR